LVPGPASGQAAGIDAKRQFGTAVLERRCGVARSNRALPVGDGVRRWTDDIRRCKKPGILGNAV